MDTLFFIIFLLSIPVFLFFLVKTLIAYGKKDKIKSTKQLKFTVGTLAVGFIALVVFVSVADSPETDKKVAGDKDNTTVPVAKVDDTKPEPSEEEKAKAKAEADAKAEEEAKEKAAAEKKAKEEADAKAKEASIPREHKSALKKAQTYAETMQMSKAGVYDQLTSEYGENFPPEAAQYAIDNLKFDWKENAVKKAQTYADTMNMSNSAVYDQLVSEYGEKFTPEEAQYGVDNLK